MQNLGFLLLLLSSTLFANVNQRLSNGTPAYYGDEFYASYPQKITKALLFKVLNSEHASIPGKPDLIVANCSNANCYEHTSVGYEGARKIMFGELFKKTDSRGTFVEDVYCGKKFYFKSASDASNMHTEVNIEHTWPQSKFNPSFDKNMQKSDMHHLYLTDSLANNKRGNFPFGDIGNNVDELNVQNCDISHLYRGKGSMLFTPPVSHRGNVARSLFYFSARYNMPIEASQEAILRIWNKADPIDQGEKDRHEVIAKYEKVRNPFIDFPELADKISDL